jgi:hypothetical protein
MKCVIKSQNIIIRNDLLLRKQQQQKKTKIIRFQVRINEIKTKNQKIKNNMSKKQLKKNNTRHIFFLKEIKIKFTTRKIVYIRDSLQNGIIFLYERQIFNDWLDQVHIIQVYNH